MNYLENLKLSAKKFNSIVSLGLDPVLEDMPVKSGSIKERIIIFYESILNKMIQENVFPSAVKPNYAFYAQYGLEGIEALLHVIHLYKAQGLPIILDAKRGDIAKTAEAYAKEAFGFFKADSVTLAPYMGYDSISPFIEKYPGRGYYILNKTSNKSAKDFQDMIVDNEPLYVHVSKKIIEWYSPGIGAVIGATYPEQLNILVAIFNGSGKDIPLLIPGIGSQGGDIKEVVKILKSYSPIGLHRINSSSAINYAYKQFNNMPFDKAAVEALKKLNYEINNYIDN